MMRLKIFLQKHLNVLILSVTVTSLLFSTLALASASEPIRTVTGIVTRVSGGDTIQVVTPEQTKIKVRLYDIDVPETPKPKKPRQLYGEESWNALQEKVYGKQVKVEIIDIDRYHRMVSIVWIGDRNINLEMVREGYAEAYTEYLKAPYTALFLAAEEEAKTARSGIWGLQEYERPRDFRKG